MPNLRPFLRPEPARLDTSWLTASEIAAAVASGKISATAIVDDALARINGRNPVLNAFTAITTERARARARAVDAAAASKQNFGPLAGVPFAVKNLFDVAGIATVAGSKINRTYPSAKR
ncbi:MAG: amidase family protein, partial [Pseudolabrys sp.]